MPQVSIVVPIYNVERYLSYCLDTLRAQTLRDIEIICVNDGSPDHSAAIAEAHASLDKRIRVINKPNGGLSSARNAGIDAARGDFLMFVDSDDYLAEEACESVVFAFESNDADVVTFGAHCVPQTSNNDWLDCVLSPRDRVYHEFTEDLLFAESSRPFAWRTAVRKQFIDAHELRFDENVPFGEDQVFHFDIYPLARTTALISDKLYYYRLSRKDSLMSTFANSSKWRVPKHIDIVGAILTHWDERGLMDLCPVRLMDWILDFLCYDLFRLSIDQQKECLAKLGSIFESHFEDAVTTANTIFPVMGDIVRTSIELANGSRHDIPRSLARNYTRFRVGLLAMARDWLRGLFSRDEKGHVEDELDNLTERLEGEEALGNSLVKLIAQTKSQAYVPQVDNTRPAR